MEPIRCPCGTPISHIYEAFKLMSKIYLKNLPDQKSSAIEFNMLTPNTNVNQMHIFKALGMENAKYCCKTRLVASAQFHDLEVVDNL